MFQTKVAEKIKTPIVCSVTFFLKSCHSPICLHGVDRDNFSRWHYRRIILGRLWEKRYWSQL